MEIVSLEHTNISLQDVFELIQSSFQQWKDAGIDSSVLHMTLDQFQERTRNSTVFVALDDEANLIGTSTCALLCDKQGDNYMFHKYVAISNQAKKSGVGSELMKKEKQFAVEHNCEYILSDTSELAIWSIRWHKKNGFKAIRYDSFDYNNFFSYILRCQLKSPSIWNNPIYTHFLFSYYYLKTKAMKRHDGTMTWFGEFLSKIT